MEHRQIATVADILAIELKCGHDNCGTVTSFDTTHYVLRDDLVCPHCGTTWWTKTSPSNERNLVEAILGVRHEKHRDENAPRVKFPPVVRFVLPGTT